MLRKSANIFFSKWSSKIDAGIFHRRENLKSHTVILYKTETATNHTTRCHLPQKHHLNFFYLVLDVVAQCKLNSPVTEAGILNVL
jgi:hypothetical protein